VLSGAGHALAIDAVEGLLDALGGHLRA
jgi:hypothetical protein